MKTITIQTRVDSNLKDNAERLFNSMGLDLTSAIRLFLTQSVIQRKIPFESVAPETFNEETIRALDETEEILSGKRPYRSFSSIEEARSFLECAESEPEYK